MLRWFEQTGNSNDVVLSSKVSLVRNIKAYRFPHKMKDQEQYQLREKVFEALEEIKVWKDVWKIFLEDLEPLALQAYCERGLFPNTFGKQHYAGVFCSRNEAFAILVNGENHIQLQASAPGWDLRKLYEEVSTMEELLGDCFEYAFEERLGFLTAVLEHLGTGFKASVVLHLPALCAGRRIQSISKELEEFGLHLEPLYLEKGNPQGHLFQLVNSQTLGIREEKILENFSKGVELLVTQERKGRSFFQERDRLRMEDEIYKSYGLLRYARKMSFPDALLLLSRLRLGIYTGLIGLSEEQPFVTQQLLMGIQDANLQLGAGREVEGAELEALRAAFLRENIPLLN